jgi:predicted metalloprotease with PDZ domain
VDDFGKMALKMFFSDLSKMVESATNLMGDILYKKYAFICINSFGGGLEHLSSSALSFNAKNMTDSIGYKNWLSFVSHEYFHLYNVKRIRPITLGPFDYEKENYTKLLWFSEGATVYYEDIVLNRAGLLPKEEFLEKQRKIIRTFENSPGHLFQSVAQSSLDTWIMFFNRNENTANTSLSRIMIKDVRLHSYSI